MAKPDKETYYLYAQDVYDFFLSIRFSPAQASGMVAYVDKCSSFDSSKGYFGLDQDRVDVICNGNKQYPGCGIKMDKDTGLSTVLEAIWHDLRHMEKDALPEILGCETAYDAGYAVALYYGRLTAAAAEKTGIDAEAWLKYFAEVSNTLVANSTANTATSNNTTAYTAGVYADTTTSSTEDFKKNSKFADANNETKDTKTTANNDTADNINDNISNVNYFDKAISKKPDETTYLDTPTTSNTAYLDRELTSESKEVKKVTVSNTETVNTATSVISANTVKFYANTDVANTIPLNSNRTRGENDPIEDDFTTDLSNKTEETKRVDDIANGRVEPTKEEEKEKEKKVVKSTKESAKKDLTKKPSKKDEEKKETVSEKAEKENDATKQNVFREYYTANTKPPESSSNTVAVAQSNNTQA